MTKRGLPTHFVSWYGSYLSSRTATISLAGITITRSIRKGTPQGGVLSPILWNIAFEPLLKKMGKFAFVTGFADDGCALVMGTDLVSCQRRLSLALQAAENGEERQVSPSPQKKL